MFVEGGEGCDSITGRRSDNMVVVVVVVVVTWPPSLCFPIGWVEEDVVVASRPAMNGSKATVE
jgi:hypothetical protein